MAEPVPGPGEVLVEVEAAGICGSDLHVYGDEIAIPIRVPVVVGHEFSGVVAAVGDKVESVAPGMRVTALPSVRICGECRYCRSGAINLCLRRESMGYWHDGSFAPLCVAPERCIRELPTNVGFRAAALSEPLACAVHAVVELTRVSAGDLVAVVGPGSIGLLCLQVALAEGGRAVVLGRREDRKRLELALRLGAERVVVVEGEDAGSGRRRAVGRVRSRRRSRVLGASVRCRPVPEAGAQAGEVHPGRPVRRTGGNRPRGGGRQGASLHRVLRPAAHLLEPRSRADAERQGRHRGADLPPASPGGMARGVLTVSSAGKGSSCCWTCAGNDRVRRAPHASGGNCPYPSEKQLYPQAAIKVDTSELTQTGLTSGRLQAIQPRTAREQPVNELREKIESAVNRDRLLETATALIEVPSPTLSAADVAGRLEELLRADGFEVERPVCDWPESPAVVGAPALRRGGARPAGGRPSRHRAPALRAPARRGRRSPRLRVLRHERGDRRRRGGDASAAGVRRPADRGNAADLPRPARGAVGRRQADEGPYRRGPPLGRGDAARIPLRLPSGGRPRHVHLRDCRHPGGGAGARGAAAAGLPDVVAAGAELVTRFQRENQRLGEITQRYSGCDSFFVGFLQGGEIYNRRPSPAR